MLPLILLPDLRLAHEPVHAGSAPIKQESEFFGSHFVGQNRPRKRFCQPFAPLLRYRVVEQGRLEKKLWSYKNSEDLNDVSI